jgi:hypothetical protein
MRSGFSALIFVLVLLRFVVEMICGSNLSGQESAREDDLR